MTTDMFYKVVEEKAEKQLLNISIPLDKLREAEKNKIVVEMLD